MPVDTGCGTFVYSEDELRILGKEDELKELEAKNRARFLEYSIPCPARFADTCKIGNKCELDNCFGYHWGNHRIRTLTKEVKRTITSTFPSSLKSKSTEEKKPGCLSRFAAIIPSILAGAS